MNPVQKVLVVNVRCKDFKRKYVDVLEWNVLEKSQTLVIRMRTDDKTDWRIAFASGEWLQVESLFE